MHLIYKNLTVDLYLNLDANAIVAFCVGADTSKFKTEEKSGVTIKTVSYQDLTSLKFNVTVPIDPNNKSLPFDLAGNDLDFNFIIENICKKIDEHLDSLAHTD